MLAAVVCPALLLPVVLATFYVMRSWSMWLGRTRRRGLAPELAGFGAMGPQVSWHDTQDRWPDRGPAFIMLAVLTVLNISYAAKLFFLSS